MTVYAAVGLFGSFVFDEFCFDSAIESDKLVVRTSLVKVDHLL